MICSELNESLVLGGGACREPQCVQNDVVLWVREQEPSNMHCLFLCYLPVATLRHHL
jgi:hypothetical protein